MLHIFDVGRLLGHGRNGFGCHPGFTWAT
jgi:hypothetical protein